MVCILPHIFWFLHIFCHCSMWNHLVILQMNLLHISMMKVHFSNLNVLRFSEYRIGSHSGLSNESCNNQMYLRQNAKISSQICSVLFHPFCGHFWWFYPNSNFGCKRYNIHHIHKTWKYDLMLKLWLIYKPMLKLSYP